MRILGVAAVAMLLTAPAYAQMPNINLLQDGPSKTQEEKEQQGADAEEHHRNRGGPAELRNAKTRISTETISSQLIHGT